MWLYNGEILSQHISTLLKPIHSLLSTQNSKPQETIMAGHLGRLKVTADSSALSVLSLFAPKKHNSATFGFISHWLCAAVPCLRLSMTRRAHLARSPGAFHSPCGAHRPEIWRWSVGCPGNSYLGSSNHLLFQCPNRKCFTLWPITTERKGNLAHDNLK